MVYGLSTMVPKFLNYLLVPFYTNLFNPSEFGVITELYAWAVTINILMTYGMETGFFRFTESEPDKQKVYSTSFYSIAISTLVIVAVSLIFSGSISRAFRFEQYPSLISFFIVLLGMDALMAIPFVKLRSENRPMRFAFLKIGNVVVNIGLNLFFLLLCPYLIENFHWANFITTIYYPDWQVGYVFISNLLANLCTLILLTPQLKGLGKSIDKSLLKRMLVYSLPLMIAGLEGGLNETLDRLMLKYLLPDPETAQAQLGIYGSNVRLAVLMALFTQMFRFAAEPFFFRYAKENDSRQVFADVTKFFTIFGIIIFLLITFNLDWIQYFEGEAFREGLHIVPMLLVANLLLGIYFNLSIWFKLSNQTYYGAILMFLGVLVTLFINIMFVPHFGYTASAWGRVATYITLVVVCFAIGQKKFPIPYQFQRIGLYALVASGLYVVVQYIQIESLFLKIVVNNLIILSFTTFVIYKEKKTIPFLKRNQASKEPIL